MLTFDQLNSKEYLIRVEHYFELNEDATYSHPVTFDLQTIFKSQGTIVELFELTLGANLPLADMKRLDWITSENESSHVDGPAQSILKDTTVALNPMQIRTFRVTLQ